MQTIDRIFKAQLDIKKSNFLAFLCPISEFKSLHERLKEEHFKAVHVVWATRELNKYGQIVENQSDDGEPKGTSGQPSLNALRGADLINVGVLIVRYFGGIKLGTGGLVRAYSGAVNEVINEAIKDGGVMKFEIKDETKFFTPFSLMSRFEHYFSTKNLSEFLEKKVYEIEHADKKPQIGQVNGLAWTSVGGDVLKIEAIRIQGKGGLQITGSLGEVMKESAYIAFSLVKVLIDAKKIKVPSKIIPSLAEDVKDGVKKELSPSEVYRRYDLHIHVPEGATPKDGPSAGITMVTAIASILTDTKVRSDVAMTGEITLSGRVLPIGGLKEKLIAAHKAGIKTALIPRKNYERDLGDIPQDVKNDMQIIPVDVIEDVLKNAFVAK